MSDLLSRLNTRTMPHKDVPICLNLELIAERDEAMRQLAVAHSRTKDADDQRMAGESAAVAAARAAVADVEDRIRAASIVIRITGVDRTTYNQFFLACPPRKGKQEAFDSTKFYMYAASQTGMYVDEAGDVHEMSTEEWAKIDSLITDGEHDRIAKAVLEVNREVGGSDIGFLGDASATTRDSFGISASRGTSASLPAGSGDGNRKRSTSKK